MSNKTEMVKILAMLAATFPRYTLTKDTTEIYIRLLSDIPVEELRTAALNCATSKTFFPSVHELREAVMNLRGKVSGLPTAYEAWADLKKAGPGRWNEMVEEDGKYYIEEHVYKFSHPLVKHVAELLGWPRDFPGENIVADRAHYFKAYEQAANNLMADETMLPEVRGYIEKSKHKQLEAGNGRRGKTETISDVQRRLSEGSGE